MRINLFVLLFCSCLIIANASDRDWFNNPHFAQGQGMMGATIVHGYWTIVWSNWPGEVEKPTITPSNYTHASFGCVEGNPWSCWYIAPGDVNDAHDPQVESGTNYYVTYDTESFDYNYVVGSGGDLQANYDDYRNLYVIYSTNGPPDTNYYAYFDLQGVAFFDGQTNKSFVASLFLAEGSSDVDGFSKYYENSVYNSGSYLLSHGPVLIEHAGGVSIPLFYFWVVTVTNRLAWQSGIEQTSGGNPNYHHYIVNYDHQDYNTNTPYIPPDATNYPPDNSYPDYPPPWDTNIYGPCPPDYSPWPPPYPAPPPLTSWPAYPPPNWPYSTNVPYVPPYYPIPTNNPYNPTNYDGGGGESTNGGFGFSLSNFYSALRRALRDEANQYTPSDPARYGLTYTNDLLAKADSYTRNFYSAAGDVQTNTDNIILKGQGLLDDSTALLSLPVGIGSKTTLNFGHLPVFDQDLVFTVADWPVVAVFRSLIKWCMYFTAFWLGFRLIRRTLARAE